MNTVYLITLFLGFSMFCRSQNYPIGHATTTYSDASRGNRPIPSGDYASIKGSCSGNGQIYVSISDIAGRNIRGFVLRPTENQFRVMLDMNAWESGIYFAGFRSLQETRVVKIVKN